MITGKTWWANEKTGGWVILVRVCAGERGVHRSFSIFCSVFELFLLSLSWLVHDSPGFCFIASFLLSLTLILLIMCLLIVHRKCCMENYSKSQTSGYLFVDSLERGRVLWFQRLFTEFAIFYASELHFYIEFIISACWFIIPIHWPLDKSLISIHFCYKLLYGCIVW